MQEQELKEGTRVFASDGDELGKINRFVLDPDTDEVTHIVISKGGLFSEDKVVPFDKVHFDTDGTLVLDEAIDDYDDLPPFEETHFVDIGDREAERIGRPDPYAGYPSGPAYYWYPPYGYLGYPAYGLAPYGYPLAVTEQNIPADSVPLREGSDVISSDGEHVGDVERLLLDEGSHRVTHFLISQGILFQDHKLVPANWIRSVTEDGIRLSVSSKVLEDLPDYHEE